MNEWDDLLTETFTDLGRRAPHNPRLAADVRRRARRQGTRAAAAAAVCTVVGVSAAVAAARDGGSTPGGSPGTGPAGTGPATRPAAVCAPAVQSGVLPEWARAGFSSAEPRIPFVLGRSGDIVAILFAQPLRSPQVAGRFNKILWVARTLSGSGPLYIDARLSGSDLRVAREVADGPGPSIVDLPRPGCWHLDLRWSGGTDSLDLEYAGR